MVAWGSSPGPLYSAGPTHPTACISNALISHQSYSGVFCIWNWGLPTAGKASCLEAVCPATRALWLHAGEALGWPPLSWRLSPWLPGGSLSCLLRAEPLTLWWAGGVQDYSRALPRSHSQAHQQSGPKGRSVFWAPRRLALISTHGRGQAATLKD